MILYIAWTGVIVSASVSAVIIAVGVAVFTTVIIFLIRTKTRLQAELATYKISTARNYDEVIPSSRQETIAFDTIKNVAYSVRTPQMKTSDKNNN